MHPVHERCSTLAGVDRGYIKCTKGNNTQIALARKSPKSWIKMTYFGTAIVTEPHKEKKTNGNCNRTAKNRKPAITPTQIGQLRAKLRGMPASDSEHVHSNKI